MGSPVGEGARVFAGTVGLVCARRPAAAGCLGRAWSWPTRRMYAHGLRRSDGGRPRVDQRQRGKAPATGGPVDSVGPVAKRRGNQWVVGTGEPTGGGTRR